MIVTDPDEVCGRCLLQDIAQIRDLLKIGEFAGEFVDVFMARRGIDLIDVGPDPFQRCVLDSGDFPDSF